MPHHYLIWPGHGGVSIDCAHGGGCSLNCDAAHMSHLPFFDNHVLCESAPRPLQEHITQHGRTKLQCGDTNGDPVLETPFLPGPFTQSGFTQNGIYTLASTHYCYQLSTKATLKQMRLDPVWCNAAGWCSKQQLAQCTDLHVVPKEMAVGVKQYERGALLFPVKGLQLSRLRARPNPQRAAPHTCKAGDHCLYGAAARAKSPVQL